MGTHPIFESDFDCLTENVNIEREEKKMEEIVAYTAIALAVAIFGTNFIPVKTIATGDGLFFQLIVCVHIWLVGPAICFIRQSFVMHPLPMLGGFLWATGNLCKVPIIKTVGLGIGQIVWASTNCIFGWAIARFGLFGGIVQEPSINWLNYVGVGLTCVSLLIFSAVDSHGKEQPSIGDRNNHIADGHLENGSQVDASTKLLDDPDFTDNLSQTLKKALGMLLSLFSGLFLRRQFLSDYACRRKGNFRIANGCHLFPLYRNTGHAFDLFYCLFGLYAQLTPTISTCSFTRR